MTCGAGGKLSSDYASLWLWCRLATSTPIQSLAWEPPHAVGAALKNKKIVLSFKIVLKINLKNYMDPLFGDYNHVKMHKLLEVESKSRVVP